MRLSLVAAAALLLALPVARAGAPGTVVQTPQVRAELLAFAPQGIAPGKSLWLGLQLTHQPDWHTYWRNPGDSGLPTELHWQLPAALKPGAIQWPAPTKFPVGRLVNYGYDASVLLPVAVAVAPGLGAPTVQVGLHADWLVCRTECIPQQGDFSLALPVGEPIAAARAAFDTAFAAQPRALQGGGTAHVQDDWLALQVDALPATARGRALAAFAQVAGVIDPAAPGTQQWRGAQWQARLPLARERSESPPRLALVLRAGKDSWRIDLPVTGAWPRAAAADPKEAMQRANSQSQSRPRVLAGRGALPAAWTPAGSPTAPALQALEWEPGRIDQLLAAGRTVWLDVSAADCAPCRWQERAVLASAGVQARFAKEGIALLRADTSRNDPALTAQLQSLGHFQAPLQVLYRPNAVPVVIAGLASEGDIARALAKPGS